MSFQDVKEAMLRGERGSKEVENSTYPTPRGSKARDGITEHLLTLKYFYELVSIMHLMDYIGHRCFAVFMGNHQS